MESDRYHSTDFRSLALWAATLPLLTINASYLFAMALDHVPACVPYVSGCTSVSSTGRAAPESVIFKAGMIPTAVILVLLWHRCATFLHGGGQNRSRFIAIRLLGVMAALSLTLYAVTLGISGDDFRLVRRIGTRGFALGSFMTQVMFLFTYRPMRIAATDRLWRWLVALCLALPALGVAAEIAKWAGAPGDAANNLAAWYAFAAMSAWFAVMSRLPRHHGAGGRSDSTSSGRAASPRL